MKNYFIYPALILTIFFSACNDGEKFQGPPDDKNTDPKTTNDYFLSNRDDMLQEFTFDNGSAEAVDIKTKGGITFTIQPGTFTRDGVSVEGTVDIQVYEMLTRSAMALSGTNTNYNGGRYGHAQYFVSDGFFNINATAGGKALDSDLANRIWVKFPNPNEDRHDTRIWFGTEEAGEGRNVFAWDDPDDGKDDENWVEGLEDFEFDFGKLGWYNCDVLPGGQYTVTVKLTGEFGKFASYLAGDGATYVFYAAKDSQILAQLYTVVDGSTVKSYDRGMPAGSGRLFAFSIEDGVYTYGETEITIEADAEFTIDMKKVDKDYIDKRIASLDGYK